MKDYIGRFSMAMVLIIIIISFAQYGKNEDEKYIWKIFHKN